MTIHQTIKQQDSSTIAIGDRVAVTISDWQLGETTVAGTILGETASGRYRVEVTAGLARHVFEVERDHVALTPALVIEGRFGQERRDEKERARQPITPRQLATGDAVTVLLADDEAGQMFAPGIVTRVYPGGRSAQVQLGQDLRVLASTDDIRLGEAL